MTTIHDLLDEYAQMARDTREKGLLLERLARAYLTTDPIWFSARFSGRPVEVIVPSGAVLAVFARENGEGVVFGEVEPPGPGDKQSKPKVEVAPEKSKGARAHLKLVK